MGYVTAQQLIEKYGSGQEAVEAFLDNTMLDPDERDAVVCRLSRETFIMTRLSRIEHKLDLLLKRGL